MWKNQWLFQINSTLSISTCPCTFLIGLFSTLLSQKKCFLTLKYKLELSSWLFFFFFFSKGHSHPPLDSGSNLLINQETNLWTSMSTSTPHTAAYILDVDTMILTLQCIHSICSAFMFIKSFYWWRACSRSPLGLWRHKKNKANGPINLLLLHSCNLPAYIIWLDKVFKCLYSVLNNDN